MKKLFSALLLVVGITFAFFSTPFDLSGDDEENVTKPHSVKNVH